MKCHWTAQFHEVTAMYLPHPSILIGEGDTKHIGNRDLPRFFDQVGHQTTDASIGNKHFFTK